MKFLSIRSVIGLLGLVIAGALAGLAAGVNVVTDIGLVDPKAFGITVLVIGIVGALGGMSIGLATFCRRERDSSQKAMSMLVKLEMAQVAWVLLTAGASLPYLAVVVSTAPYL